MVYNSFHDPTCGSGDAAPKVPYVMGAARGIRAFNIDRDGRLRGVTYPEAWKEGENVATCYVTDYFASLNPSPFMRFFGGGWRGGNDVGGYTFSDGDDPPVVDDDCMAMPCSGVEKSCTCGYYAYHSDLEAYHNIERAVAVIEGYGRVILGTKGFRAQKARVVGIVLPYADRDLEAETEQLTKRLEVLNQALETAPDALLTLARSTKGIVAIAVIVGTLLIVRPIPTLTAGFIMGALTGLGLFAETHCRAALRVFRASLVAARNTAVDDLVKMSQDRAWHVKARAEKFRARYPNIPTYDSVAELLKAHPTTDLGYLADPRQEHPES